MGKKEQSNDTKRGRTEKKTIGGLGRRFHLRGAKAPVALGCKAKGAGKEALTLEDVYWEKRGGKASD